MFHGPWLIAIQFYDAHKKCKLVGMVMPYFHYAIFILHTVHVHGQKKVTRVLGKKKLPNQKRFKI